MKNKQKILTGIYIALNVLVVITTLINIFVGPIVDIRIIVLLLAVALIISGVNQINITKELLLDGVTEVPNKSVSGVISIVIGAVLIVVDIIGLFM